MPAKIAVVGSLNMDLVVRAPHMPIPGETVIGSDFRTIPGGKGANQAVAAARLGAEVTMIGRVGDDDFGRAQLRNLGELGIDTTHVIVDPEAATGIALITLDASGQNSIVLASGANMRLAREDINAAQVTIVQSDVLVLQLESPLEVVTYAIDIAHAEGVKVILNPAPARPLPEETLARLDYLIPNESETALLTGIEVTDIHSAKEAAERLREEGVGTVILTLGARGAFLVSAEESVHVPGYKVEVVDTTAAGDAFVGGLAVALAQGQNLAEAARYANAAGALAVTRLGAQPSLPTRQEVEEFMKGRS
ncbi:MAG: ribokinase [Anaerolineales bacterium]|nr:MAG: ribokinase [Anaerolineales bacterium]